MRFSPIDILRSRRHSGAHRAAVLALLVMAGCGKSNTGPTPDPNGTSDYTGAVTGVTTSGKLAVKIAIANPTVVTGGYRAQFGYDALATFTRTAPTAAVVDLHGLYDTDFHAFTVTGPDAGKEVEFVGHLVAYGFNPVDGTPDTTGRTLPVPPAAEPLHASLFKGTTDVIVVLGTFTSTAGASVTGQFSFAISGSELHGNAVAADSTWTPLDGTYNHANSDSVLIAAATNPFPTPMPTPAIGTYNPVSGVASGTYDAGSGNTGTWTGTKQP